MSVFKHLDIMSAEPKLYVNSMTRYKNAWGALVTLISMLLTLISAIYLLVELLEKNKPKIIYNEEVNEDPSLNFTNYPIIFTVVDNNQKQFEFPEKLFTYSPVILKINYKKLDAKGDAEVKYLNIDYKQCDNFTNFNFTHFETFQNRKNNSLCLDTSNNFRLRGAFSDTTKEAFHVLIRVRKCRNSTANAANPCFPQEFVDYQLSRSMIHLSFIDYKINNNLDSDLQMNVPYFKNYFLTMNSQMAKQTRLLFRNVKYEVDDGLFFKNNHTMTFFKQIEIENDYYILDPGVSTFMNVILTMSRNREYYSVSFDKFVNVLANVGAVWNVLFFLGQILIKYFIVDFYYLYICFYNKITDSDNHLIAFDKVFFKRNHSIYQKMKTFHIKNFTRKKDQLDPSRFESSILKDENDNIKPSNKLNLNKNIGNIKKFSELDFNDKNNSPNLNVNSNSNNCPSVSLKNLDHLKKQSNVLSEFHNPNNLLISNNLNNREISHEALISNNNTNNIKLFENFDNKIKDKNVNESKNELNNKEDLFNFARINYTNNKSKTHLPLQNNKEFNSFHLQKNINNKLTESAMNNFTLVNQIEKSSKNNLFQGFKTCMIFKRGMNKTLFKKLKVYINKKLSIEEILRKILEIEKLKFLVLKDTHLQNLFYQMPTRFAFEKEFDRQSEKLNLSLAKKNLNIGEVNDDNEIFTNDLMIRIRNFWNLNEFI